MIVSNTFLYSSLLAACFTVVSCGNFSEEIKEEPVEIQAKKDTYGSSINVIPSLSDQAKIHTQQWSVFEEFEENVRSISGSTKEKLRTTSERLVRFTDSLATKIPDTLNSTLISSRLTVVMTRAHLLNQEVQKARVDSLKLEIAITEMTNATANFIVQLNEKFEKDAIDFQRRDNEEKELEKQERFLDSVHRVELNDTSNGG